MLSALTLASGVRTLTLLHTALLPLLAPSAAAWLRAALPAWVSCGSCGDAAAAMGGCETQACRYLLWLY